MRKLLVLTAALGGIVAAATAGAAVLDTLSITANPTAVAYGKTTTISGMLTPAKANQNITIQAQECGKPNFAKATTVKTSATGAYTAVVTPTVATTYQAKLKATLSGKVSVSVKPLLQLTRVARGSYTAKVTAAQALTGKYVLFQRYSTLKKRWVQVKKVTLTTAANATKPTVVTSASFKAKVARRARVRLRLTTPQAAPCYVTATSNVVRA
jgi:ubiquitin